LEKACGALAVAPGVSNASQRKAVRRRRSYPARIYRATVDACAKSDGEVFPLPGVLGSLRDLPEPIDESAHVNRKAGRRRARGRRAFTGLSDVYAAERPRVAWQHRVARDVFA
jgi:hypothetical protein